jgi:hypothetical protein
MYPVGCTRQEEKDCWRRDRQRQKISVTSQSVRYLNTTLEMRHALVQPARQKDEDQSPKPSLSISPMPMIDVRGDSGRHSVPLQAIFHYKAPRTANKKTSRNTEWGFTPGPCFSLLSRPLPAHRWRFTPLVPPLTEMVLLASRLAH